MYQPSALTSHQVTAGNKASEVPPTQKLHSDEWVATTEHLLLLQDLSACVISLSPEGGGAAASPNLLRHRC